MGHLLFPEWISWFRYPVELQQVGLWQGYETQATVNDDNNNDNNNSNNNNNNDNNNTNNKSNLYSAIRY